MREQYEKRKRGDNMPDFVIIKYYTVTASSKEEANDIWETARKAMLEDGLLDKSEIVPTKY